MSYASDPDARVSRAPGLGFYLPEEPFTDTEARSYLEEKWAEFLDLSRQIINLQHRAALAKQAAAAVGDTQKEEAALVLIEDLGYLNQWHNEIVFRAEQIGGAVGLGAIQLPVGVAAVTALALLVLWSFRRYAAQERALEAIEDGTITPEQLIALNADDPPGQLVSSVSGLLKWGAILIAGYAILQGLQAFRMNPPLVTFHENPPGGEMSDEVIGVYYRQSQDGELYEHLFDRPMFGKGVRMNAEPDGSIRIFHPDHVVWDEFQ